MRHVRYGLIISTLVVLTGVLFLFFSGKNFSINSLCNREKEKANINGSYFKPVHIVAFQSEIPCVELQLENTTVIAQLALGFNGNICLPSSILNTVQNKKFIREIYYSRMGENKCVANLYTLPRIQMGTVNLLNAKISEIPSPIGKIGWNTFRKLNLFLDCNLWLIAFCDSLETLSKQGYSEQSFIECPMSLDRQFIEFEALTENGPLRCILDTGATLNFLNVKGIDAIHQISAFQVGNKNLGPVLFHPLDSALEIDAILGMEFLHSRQIFIDFSQSKIYFSDSSL